MRPQRAASKRASEQTSERARTPDSPTTGRDVDRSRPRRRLLGPVWHDRLGRRGLTIIRHQRNVLWALLWLEDGKQPYFIHGDGHVLAAAGLYAARQKDDMWKITFTIITRAARDASGEIHDRMLVFLTPDVWDQWLIPVKIRDKEEAPSMLDRSSVAQPRPHSDPRYIDFCDTFRGVALACAARPEPRRLLHLRLGREPRRRRDSQRRHCRARTTDPLRRRRCESCSRGRVVGCPSRG
ncbi:hypothetical protein E3T26_03820 [Cryobacterium sp. TMT1-21]|nr:hypothetical protein E3T26_03820 [Cryobacterium sp. TMT1-21]